MLWFETLYESIGLPELDRMAVDRGSRDPSRLVFIGTADIDPADDAAVRPDNVSPVLFHLADAPPICPSWLLWRLSRWPRSGRRDPGIDLRRRVALARRSKQRCPFFPGRQLTGRVPRVSRSLQQAFFEAEDLLGAVSLLAARLVH
jgi:hypothetical protein